MHGLDGQGRFPSALASRQRQDGEHQIKRVHTRQQLVLLDAPRIVKRAESSWNVKHDRNFTDNLQNKFSSPFNPLPLISLSSYLFLCITQ